MRQNIKTSLKNLFFSHVFALRNIWYGWMDLKISQIRFSKLNSFAPHELLFVKRRITLNTIVELLKHIQSSNVLDILTQNIFKISSTTKFRLGRIITYISCNFEKILY